jgi:hypothetical protein
LKSSYKGERVGQGLITFSALFQSFFEMSAIPLLFVVARVDAERPPVSFDAPPLSRGGSVTVRASSDGGWVFCGLEEDGSGKYLVVRGGNAKLLSGFSGDETDVEFSITHDGVSSEVVVTYNTRAD